MISIKIRFIYYLRLRVVFYYVFSDMKNEDANIKILRIEQYI